jgi:hydroxymethylbilane synthase
MTVPAPLKLGTRGSALALAQARAVAARLRALGADVEVVPVRTEGDRLLEARLATVGGKGLFVREIEEALLEGALDLAVHSLKDLPAELPAGLTLAAYVEREDPRDVLVARAGVGFGDLPAGAVIGTSSPRRRALALALRPDLVVEPIRGNVDTRVRKLESGPWDAVILAAAGLSRLGLRLGHARPLDPTVFVPAVGQGTLAVEVRAADRTTRVWVDRIDHAPTRVCALAERAYLHRLGASCQTPMAAYAALDAGRLQMTAFVASEDGRRVLRGAESGTPDECLALGRRLAEALLAQGAAAVAALRV